MFSCPVFMFLRKVVERELENGFFVIACEAGRRLGAEKLYISAHSSKESQAFYHAIGCIEAKEYNRELSEAEPCDCQLEFVL